MAIADELQRYPRTGRFLMGRLRDARSPEERQEIENVVEVERTTSGGLNTAMPGWTGCA